MTQTLSMVRGTFQAETGDRTSCAPNEMFAQILSLACIQLRQFIDFVWWITCRCWCVDFVAPDFFVPYRLTLFRVSKNETHTHTRFIHRIIWISDIELMASIQTFSIWKWMDEVRHSTASHQAVKINATTWPQWISSRDVKCEWNAVYLAVVLFVRGKTMRISVQYNHRIEVW